MVIALLAFAYVAIAVADLPPRNNLNTPPQPQLSSTAGVSAPVGLAAVPFAASQCQTLEELEAWRHKVLDDQIHKFVPQQFQQFASKSIESEYHKRKVELEAAGGPVVAGDLPEMLSASVGSINAGMSIKGSSWHVEQPRMGPQSAGGDLRHMLADVVKCNSREELEVWRLRLREFAEKELPLEIKPFALADVQRHFEIRLADLRQVSTAPAAQVLAQMLADVDHCTSEPELLVWRENVASHIRSHLVTRFQIPALTNMQLRFDRRLDIIQSLINPQIKTNATESSKVVETVEEIVIGGLILPWEAGVMALVAAFTVARRKYLAATPISDGEIQLLEEELV